MSENKKWIITTSGEKPLDEIKKNLTETGFEIEQSLDEIGCIIGTASDDTTESARGISGITDISPDESIDIGPPDAPTTW